MRETPGNSRGETLVEVLASVLVCALSATLLLGAVTASSGIDLRAREADGAYYEALSKAERQGPGDVFTPGGTLTVTNQDGVSKELAGLAFYGGEGLLSYAAAPPSGGGGGGP